MRSVAMAAMGHGGDLGVHEQKGSAAAR